MVLFYNKTDGGLRGPLASIRYGSRAQIDQNKFKKKSLRQRKNTLS